MLEQFSCIVVLKYQINEQNSQYIKMRLALVIMKWLMAIQALTYLSYVKNHMNFAHKILPCHPNSVQGTYLDRWLG
jgi:hypothetical protein